MENQLKARLRGDYYVLFSNQHGSIVKTEVSKSIFDALKQLSREEEAARRSDARHIDYISISEQEFNRCKATLSQSTEDIVIGMELAASIHEAIYALPDIQRRRFLMYCEYELSLQQIAEIEGCTKNPVKRSIDKAKKTLREQLKSILE